MPMPTRRHRLAPRPLCAAAALLLLAAAHPLAATAQPRTPHTPPPQVEDTAHTVREGDTLEGLARLYLDAPGQWPQLQARNRVANPRRLRPGSVIWIPAHLQPGTEATVGFVHGDATAQAAEGTAPEPLAPGARLQEGARLQVGPDAFVSVTLADGSVVRVQAQTDVQLRHLRRRGRAGSVQAVMEVRGGAVESSVAPSAEAFRRFEIRTPLAVTSVRGTRFVVGVAGSGQTTAAVLEGALTVQARDNQSGAGQPQTAALAPAQGIVVAADGALGAVQSLLHPPDLSAVPEVLSDAGLLAIDIPTAPGTARHAAQVSRDADGTQVLRSGSFAQGQLRFAMPEDGRYYLAVRAVSEAGIPGLPALRPFSVKTRPVAPLYQQPAPGAVVATGAGTLACTPVPGARWYRLQIAADAGFAAPLRDEARLDECALPLGNLPAGSYFWRAASVAQRPDGSADQGPFAPAQPFLVADRPAPLSAQALQAQDGDTTVRLHWPRRAGQRFRLQLAAAGDPSFSDIRLDTLLEEPTWTAGDLPAGEYLVRIQVQDPSGLQGEFSAPRLVRVGTGIRTGSGLPISTTGGAPLGRP